MISGDCCGPGPDDWKMLHHALARNTSLPGMVRVARQQAGNARCELQRPAQISDP